MTPELIVYPSLCLCLCVTHTCTYVHTCIITQVINRLATDMEKILKNDGEDKAESEFP